MPGFGQSGFGLGAFGIGETGSTGTGTVDGATAFDFVNSTILFLNSEPALQAESLATQQIPNELTVEFQNVDADFSSDSLTILDTREASEFGARLTAQLNAEGFPRHDDAVRAAKLELFKLHGERNADGTVKSTGNLTLRAESSVKGVLLSTGQVVRVTWAKKGWTDKLFRVTAISPDQDARFPYWRIRYILREHDNAWYDVINGAPASVAIVPPPPPPIPPSGDDGGGGVDNPGDDLPPIGPIFDIGQILD